MHLSQRIQPLSWKRFFRSVVDAVVDFSTFFFFFLALPAAAADTALAGPAPLTAALPEPMSWPLAPIPDDKQSLQSEGPVFAFRPAVGIVEGAVALSTIDDDRNVVERGGGARAWTGLMGFDGGGGGSSGEGGARRNKGMSVEKKRKKKKEKESKRAGMGVGMGVGSSGKRGSKVYAPMAHDE
ncbi:hypothetical protein DFJ73DRAFT_778284 [Zopfochytrium polystomum]|nr:hypothetical protein DFJ73DRAFT_778284 [Zopfochytrium polystomum]